MAKSLFMKITFFGLSITSSWGNGHATTFRALCSGLHHCGHEIVFFERNTEWYENNRDLPEPSFCTVRIFEDWRQALPRVRAELRDSDVAVVGSYFPDGIAALDEVCDSDVPVKAFYDIDTPITIGVLNSCGITDYLLPRHLPELDVYFSFTGGPMLRELESRFGVPLAVPLYCSVDPDKYHEMPPAADLQCDLSYMGTYAADRQPKMEELLCAPARLLPDSRFIVAGPQYPESLLWPSNVERIIHLNPARHPEFYSSSRLTLNLTRRDMVMAGYSPSVRLFEAAACAATIVSDSWPGLETFLTPGRELLVPTGAEDVVRYLLGYDDTELRRIGRAAAERILACHTNRVRAGEFERAVESAVRRSPQSMELT
jgi:spore maturation protein CgeB